MITIKEKKRAINSLLTKGYYIFRSVLSEYKINQYSKILLKQKTTYQGGFFKNIITKKTKIILNLQMKDKIFLELIDNKLMNSINTFFLNDKNYKSINLKLPNYILNQFAARASGKEPCVIHMDDPCPNTTSQVNYLQWAIPMIETNSQNGCTTLLERSHLFGPKKIGKYSTKFKDINLKKGDVVVWDGRIWHGAKKNISNKERWVIIVTFTKWFFKPQYDIARSFPRRFYKNLNRNKKIILGFASIPKSTEKMGVYRRGDLKSADLFIKKRKF